MRTNGIFIHLSVPLPFCCSHSLANRLSFQTSPSLYLLCYSATGKSTFGLLNNDSVLRHSSHIHSHEQNSTILAGCMAFTVNIKHLFARNDSSNYHFRPTDQSTTPCSNLVRLQITRRGGSTVVDTPLLPTLVSSLQTLVVEGIMEDTMAVV